MPPKPKPTKPVKFHPPESFNTVVVVYSSPGVKGDGGGFTVIVAADKNGDQVLKIIPVGPGPGDPAWKIIQASAGLLATLDGVAGVEELRALTGLAIQQQVQSLVRD
jgi:hypothetical protein